jgi:hypothetical protein
VPTPSLFPIMADDSSTASKARRKHLPKYATCSATMSSSTSMAACGAGSTCSKFFGLGARACFLGRAPVYGLAAYGGKGVTAALNIIAAAMVLAGVSDVNAVPEGLVLRDS